MTISIRATADPTTSTIALVIESEDGKADFQLDMNQVVHMFAALTQALHDIPADRTSQLSDLTPALRAEPSYQIGSSPQGDLVLLIQASPLPPFHFVFDDEAATTLRKSLEQFLNVPRSMRYQLPQ
jgi:hypothetical protein